MSPPRPQRTADEMAAWLRVEARRAEELARTTAERRQRIDERYADEYEALTDDDARRRLQRCWADHNQRLLREVARWKDSASDYRRALQYLTGEVW